MKKFYEFLTNKGKNIFLITLLSTALLFASCINDLFNDDKASKKQETQTEQTGSEELIPVKINISNQKQIENILQNVKPQKNISQARAASPQNVTLAYKILYKKVTETSQSSTVNQDNKEYESELTDSSAVLKLSKGNWDFTLIVYFNEIVLFTGDVLNQKIGPTTENTLSFTLKEVEGKGSIKITLVIPKSDDYTTTVQAQLKKYPSQDVIDTKTDLTLQDHGDDSDKTSCVYSIGDVENGMYVAVFSITTTNSQAASVTGTDANSTETTVYPVPVRVVTNLTSESTETLSEIRNVCVITYDLGTDSSVSWKDGATPERVYKKYQNVTLPTYENLAPIETKIFNGWKDQKGTKVTPTMIIEQNVTLEADWITTTLYVDRSSTDTNPDALTTLQDAVNKLIDYEKLDGDSYQHEWTINVNGTCSGTSNLSSLGITKLTITGDNNTQDILDGSSGTGPVKTNEGTYPLFIEKLTIQKGSNTSGGGLNITNSTAYLDNVVLINNTASENGGAIALTKSRLFIYGGTKIGPDAVTNAATDTACSNRAGKNGGGIYADENSTIYFGYRVADEYAGTMTAEEDTPSNIITYNYAGTEGNGGGICCRGKLYINGGTISYNSADSNGGGISVSNETHLTGTTISGNKATTNGGGIYVESGNSAILFLSGKTTIGASSANKCAESDSASSNSAKNGGGIYLGSSTKAYLNYTSDGTIDESGIVNITYNYATAPDSNEGGGGIHAEMNSELYIAPGTTINYNATTENGGGIYGKEGTTYMSGGTIYGNNAKYGGGICLSGANYYGSEYYGTLYMYGEAKIGTSEKLIDNSYSNSALYGGGIYLADIYSKAYLGYSGINVENNLSGGVSYNKAFAATYDGPGGGGIYNLGLLQVSSGSISNNISETDGGGIYNLSNIEFSMTGGTIASNKAVNGGGVYNPSDKTFTMTGGTIESNTADGSGGGIYTTNLSMKGSTVSNNAATGEGGGIFINSSSTTKSSITSAEFDGITTSTKISGNTSSSNGAGISFTAGELYISGTTISGNKATSNGGGIYVGSGTSARLFLYGETTIGATSANTSAESKSASSNSATNGGGIYIGASAAAFLNYSSEDATNHTETVNITYNYATAPNSDEGGGGIFAHTNSKLYIAKGTTINYNATNKKGGGIFGNGNTTFMSGGTIYSNDAQYGGGIYLAGTDEYKGTLYMYGEAKIGTSENRIYDSDVDIYYSNGASYGGGIYIDDHSQAYLGYSGINEENNLKTETLTGGVYFNCAFKARVVTTGFGGGVYNSGTLRMHSGNISHNTSSETCGGGVYNVSKAEFSMTGGAIESNSAVYGGGVYNEGIFNVSKGNIKSNTVTENGGGIYTDPAEFTDKTVLEDSEITENTAKNGGGVYSISSDKLYIKGATIFKENTATGLGGAIGGENGYSIYIKDQNPEKSAFAYIEPNSACNDIYLDSSSAIFLDYNTLSPDHDYIARFTPSNYDNDGPYLYEGDDDSYKKFQVTPQTVTDTTEVEWETTSEGKIQKKQP